jgi:hypothetical protein
MLLHINTINFNYSHFMSRQVDTKHGKGSHVDKSKTIRFSREKLERDILGFLVVYQRNIRYGFLTLEKKAQT